jgi:hypothetical protein
MWQLQTMQEEEQNPDDAEPTEIVDEEIEKNDGSRDGNYPDEDHDGKDIPDEQAVEAFTVKLIFTQPPASNGELNFPSIVGITE